MGYECLRPDVFVDYEKIARVLKYLSKYHIDIDYENRKHPFNTHMVHGDKESILAKRNSRDFTDEDLEYTLGYFLWNAFYKKHSFKKVESESNSEPDLKFSSYEDTFYVEVKRIIFSNLLGKREKKLDDYNPLNDNVITQVNKTIEKAILKKRNCFYRPMDLLIFIGAPIYPNFIIDYLDESEGKKEGKKREPYFDFIDTYYRTLKTIFIQLNSEDKIFRDFYVVEFVNKSLSITNICSGEKHTHADLWKPYVDKNNMSSSIKNAEFVGATWSMTLRLNFEEIIKEFKRGEVEN